MYQENSFRIFKASVKKNEYDFIIKLAGSSRQ